MENNNNMVELFWRGIQEGNLSQVRDCVSTTPLLVNAVHPEQKLSAFEMALAAGYQKIAQALMETPDFDLDLPQHNPLRIAIELGYLDLAQELLNQGANPNYRPRGMSSALLLCLEREYFNLAELMVVKGAEVDIRNDAGWTPLIWASVKGHLKTVEFLLNHRASIHICNNEGWNAITGAYFKKRLDIVQILKEEGAVFSERFKQAVLFSAFENGEQELVLELLQDGVSPDSTDTQGESILAKAVNKGDMRLIDALIPQANVNVRDASGVPVIALLAQHGYAEQVKAVLSRGADVNLKSKMGNTALILACRYNQLETAKLLLDNGADINAVNTQKMTALMTAAEIGALELVKLLFGYKPNLLLTDDKGRTAKKWALDKAPKLNSGALRDSSFEAIAKLLTLPGHYVNDR